MQISVLISVYKAEKPQYLDRALKSVWDDQTHKPSEIILVADGELPSELEEIIEKWKHTLGESFIIVRNECNLGLPKSLNKGLKYVNNELIARMDSDDISHPKRFEIQRNFLIANQDIDIVGGALQEFNDKSSCLNIRYYPTNPDIVNKYICKGSPLAHPTVMMRKKIFDSGLCYNENYRTNEDIALWYDVLAKGHRISNVSDITIYFRLADNFYKRRGRQKAVDEFKIYMKGIYKLHGLFTISYVYPISRLAFRLMPKSIIKKVYNSKLREFVLSNFH